VANDSGWRSRLGTLRVRLITVQYSKQHTILRLKPMAEKTRRIEVYLGASLLRILDGWRRKQHDSPSREVAIQRLVKRGLVAGARIRRRPRKASGRKAAELASREIDRLGDQSASNEERTRRKRRLIKGPQEFRDVRTDLPKSKS
jgi:hypothetical protein